jgi:hypothetical protein
MLENYFGGGVDGERRGSWAEDPGGGLRGVWARGATTLAHSTAQILWPFTKNIGIWLYNFPLYWPFLVLLVLGEGEKECTHWK